MQKSMEIKDKPKSNKTMSEPENAGVSRDEQGRFLPGVSGNPEGKKPGTLSITAEIKKKLEEIPEGKSKTYLAYLIEQILKKAVIEGDQQTIKQIWNYVDGLPKMSLDVDNKGLPFTIIIQKDDGTTQG
jgi:hypothetical protein